MDSGNHHCPHCGLSDPLVTRYDAITGFRDAIGLMSANELHTVAAELGVMIIHGLPIRHGGDRCGRKENDDLPIVEAIQLSTCEALSKFASPRI